MKNYTDETIKLRANEILLSSKGFLLFTVDNNGDLLWCGDTTNLNPAEQRGLKSWRCEDITNEKYDEEL